MFFFSCLYILKFIPDTELPEYLITDSLLAIVSHLQHGLFLPALLLGSYLFSSILYYLFIFNQSLGCYYEEYHD